MLSPAAKNPKKSLQKALLNKQMLITLMMGFSSGLPYLLTLRTLQAWMTDVGVDLKTIGIFALVGLPYSFKFLWAPIFDRYKILGFGRRRGWILFSQLGVMTSIGCMAVVDPKQDPLLLAALSVMIAFFSASQDIVIDAYRRESLSEEDLGLGATFYLYGYRLAMWIAGAVAIGLAAFITWNQVYLIMAAVMLVAIATTLFSPEPTLPAAPPKTIKEAVIDPFKEFFKRRGALLILAFIVLYKLGEAMAGSMLTPFYFKMGYSKIEIAAVAKSFTLIATLVGSFIGGAVVHKKGINFSLWSFGIFQSVATLLIAFLTLVEKNLIALGGIIFLEDVSTAMATAAFVAFLGATTNKKFSATQYALFSSLSAVPRLILSTPTGYLVESMGWTWFYIFCAVITIPGLMLIPVIVRMQAKTR